MPGLRHWLSKHVLDRAWRWKLGPPRKLLRLSGCRQARPCGVLYQQTWWQSDLCRALRQVVGLRRACCCPQAAGLLRFPAGRNNLGLLVWCLVRPGGGVRGPLQGRVTESAITARATNFATASPEAPGSSFFATSPPRAASSGSVALAAAQSAQPALAPISIGGRPGCRSNCWDCRWSHPGCWHRRCHRRQVPYPQPQRLTLPIHLLGAILTFTPIHIRDCQDDDECAQACQAYASRTPLRVHDRGRPLQQ